MESEAHNFYPPQRALFKEIYVARAMNRPMDEELVSTCTAQLCKVLDVYEAHLSSKGGMQYLAGDAFTLADVMHTPYFWQVMQHKAEVLQPRPHVAAYAARITARPAFHKCLQLPCPCIDSGPCMLLCNLISDRICKFHNVLFGTNFEIGPGNYECC